MAADERRGQERVRLWRFVDPVYDEGWISGKPPQVSGYETATFQRIPDGSVVVVLSEEEARADAEELEFIEPVSGGPLESVLTKLRTALEETP